MLIPVKVKQDAINSYSSLSPPSPPQLILAECIQVASKALLGHSLLLDPLPSVLFSSFILNFKYLDGFI